MNTETTIQEMEPRATLAMQPIKFALWLFIVSIIMLFAALTSAYIVKQSDGNWLSIQLPGILVYNTFIILLSSASMQWALLMARRDQLNKVKTGLIVTVALGILFLVGQYYSWMELVEQNVFFVSNYVSGSFIYIFTGLHGLHLVSGIVFLVLTLIAAFRYKVHSKNILKIEMCTTYWHFLGGLWVYLYIFLLLNS
jgi:cytochrome c oxidase subunit 3